MFIPLAFVYVLVAVSIVAFKIVEVQNDPNAMPMCGHLRGWYAIAALWPFVFVLAVVIGAGVIAATLVVEFLER